MFILYTTTDTLETPYVITNIDNVQLASNYRAINAASGVSNQLATTSNMHNALAMVDTFNKMTGGARTLHWLDDEVVSVRHRRSQIDDQSSNKTWYKAQDGYKKRKGKTAPKGVSNRHHVPYQRIFNAWQLYCMGRTRREIFDKVLGAINTLGIPAPDFIQKIGDPKKSRMNYDVVIDWAVTSICFWKYNMFYGTGTGDKTGTLIDHPTTPILMKKQAARVEAAAQKLAQVVPELNITDDEVPVSRLFEKTYSRARGDVKWDVTDKDAIEEDRANTKKLRLTYNYDTPRVVRKEPKETVEEDSDGNDDEDEVEEEEEDDLL